MYAHLTIDLFAAITAGYVETAVNVSESNGVAQLTVAISVPPEVNQIETLFFLLVNTLDETATATGLPYRSAHTHTHTHTLSSLNKSLHDRMLSKNLA